ncbi:MAG TPA: class III extradiol ring-cleavage dioxygenase, partial [Thermoanaerobaculia bacterium]
MKAPALFFSHGAPTLAIEPGDYGRALERFGRGLTPRPRGIVVFSGHFEEPPPARATSAARPALIYDFGGFPDEMYRIEYPAPGDPRLAADVAGLLQKAGIPSALDPARGWDHGLWVPLRMAFPGADVPIVEVSQPAGASPRELLAIGAALAPLRERGVVIAGSGGIVHNLRRVKFGGDGAAVDGWAKEFDDWVAERLAAMDVESLARYRSDAPHAALAVPTAEHFNPLFVALGSL